MSAALHMYGGSPGCGGREELPLEFLAPHVHPLLPEPSEGGYACTGTNHYNRGLGVFRHVEAASTTDKQKKVELLKLLSCYTVRYSTVHMSIAMQEQRYSVSYAYTQCNLQITDTS